MRFNHLEDVNLINEGTAGVIIEAVQAEAGVIPPDIMFLIAVQKRCEEVGALFILDEIQTGFGRTGHLFAHQKYGVSPDLILIGKSMGGGMPIGAMISSKDKMISLTHNPMLGHITTFGGHPVNCAAALATLQVIKSEIDFNEVERKGALIEGLLQHKEVLEIRRKGLFFAVDLDSFEKVKTVFDYCLANGVITFWFLSTGYAFRLSPPLNISDGDIHHACKIIQEGFDQCK